MNDHESDACLEDIYVDPIMLEKPFIDQHTMELISARSTNRHGNFSPGMRVNARYVKLYQRYIIRKEIN